MARNASRSPVAPTFRACPERSKGSAHAGLKASATPKLGQCAHCCRLYLNQFAPRGKRQVRRRTLSKAPGIQARHQIVIAGACDGGPAEFPGHWFCPFKIIDQNLTVNPRRLRFQSSLKKQLRLLRAAFHKNWDDAPNFLA